MDTTIVTMDRTKETVVRIYTWQLLFNEKIIKKSIENCWIVQFKHFNFVVCVRYCAALAGILKSVRYCAGLAGSCLE